MSESLAHPVAPAARFSTRTALMDHQMDCVTKLLPTRVGALFMEMGTGKSRTLLELARVRQGKFDRLFWFAPVSLKLTVLHEILKHTDIPRDRICVFDDKTDDTNVTKNALIYVVGIESMAASNRVVLTVNALVTASSFVAIDESSYIKGNRALRTRRLTLIASRAKYRVILTGTPFSQGIVDLYSQMTFLSPRILGYRSFHSFQANHLVYRSFVANGRTIYTDEIVHTLGHDVLAARMAPYVYQIRKSECLKLPDKVQSTAYCRMTPAQQDAHDEAKEVFLIESDAEDWSPIAIFKLFTALQTIACGWRTLVQPETSLKTVVRFRHDRLDLLEGVLSEIDPGERVVIWAKYHLASEAIRDRLTAAHGPGAVARYDGQLSEQDRHDQLEGWRGGGRFLVALQASGGHGLTLNESCHSVFYADSFKYSERVQAEDRMHRIGQDRPPTYVTLHCSGSLDDRIATALRAKGNALRSFVAEVDAVRARGSKEGVRDLIRKL